MSEAEKGGHPSNCYTKEWNPEFSKDRGFKDQRPHVETKRGINAALDGVGVGFFLTDIEDELPSRAVEELEEFCQNVVVEDLGSGKGSAGQRRDAWLDDRSRGPTGSRYIRKHENPLTATGLYRLLKELQFDDPEAPNADRRLIYIANLDPYYILALAETVSCHQLPALKDAIWKHIALKTAIRVSIPLRAFPIFQMEVHLPYFALRTSPIPKAVPTVGVNASPPRQWMDLSFLEIQNRRSSERILYGMHEAQISIVICGSDFRRWIAYSFVDTKFDGKELEETDENSPYEEDPIAGGKLDANNPIDDPREYFLTVFEIRAAQVEREWDRLVRTVECGIRDYKLSHPSTLLAPSGTTNDAKNTFDWTRQTMELVSQLHHRLSEALKEWKRFNSATGDIGYFANIDYSGATWPSRTRPIFCAIKKTFEKLEDLQETLHNLLTSCHDETKALQLRLTLEANEEAQHNGVSIELAILIIYPFTLTTAYFSMPQELVPFKLNSKSFVIAVIVVMAVVRLSFSVLGTLPRRPRWIMKFTAWAKTIQLNEVLRLPPGGGALSDRSTATEPVEMTLGV